MMIIPFDPCGFSSRLLRALALVDCNLCKFGYVPVSTLASPGLTTWIADDDQIGSIVRWVDIDAPLAAPLHRARR